MGKHIDLPQLPQGKPQEQLEALYSYLYRMAEALNSNLAEIGSGTFTDEEMAVVREVTGVSSTEMPEVETLKSLIIKTAQFIRSAIDEYNMKLVGTYEAEGKLGRYVRKTRLDVDVTPTGIQQNYTFQEIIQGLKTYEINAKNYIKTGYLRTENSLPVYGVAIGKDVVTFSSDGTETYNDGNKVAELTADELSFWQNGNKVAGYTGNRISFYYGGTEVFYIQAGKLYSATDLEMNSGKTIKIDKWTFDSNGLTYTNNSNQKFFISNYALDGTNTYKGGLQLYSDTNGGNITLFTRKADNSAYGKLRFESTASDVTMLYAEGTRFAVLGSPSRPFATAFMQNIIGRPENNNAAYSLSIFLSAHDPITENYPTGKYIRFRTEETDTDNRIRLSASGPIYHNGSMHIPYLYYENIYQESSREVKHDITDMAPQGEKIDRLRPVTFIYDADPEERRRAGLIYEETAEEMPEICTGDEGNKAINYVELIPILLKEIQELRARVRALEEGGNGNVRGTGN